MCTPLDLQSHHFQCSMCSLQLADAIGSNRLQQDLAVTNLHMLAGTVYVGIVRFDARLDCSACYCEMAGCENIYPIAVFKDPKQLSPEQRQASPKLPHNAFLIVRSANH